MSTTKEAFDPDILATMTPEERAAIEDDGTTPEEQAALQAIADQAAGVTDDDDDDDQGRPQALQTPLPAASAPTAAAADDTAGKDGEEDAEVEAAIVPRYDARLPADYADQVAAINNHRKDLAANFKAGDIDFDQYTAENDAALEALSNLKTQGLKAEISREMNVQTAEQQWNASIRRHVARVKKVDGIDYDNDPVKGKDLDNFVKVLAADPANGDKGFDWYLTEAHKYVKAKHGIGGKPKADDPQKPGVPAPRKPPIDGLPKTLAHVPGGDGPGDVTDEFSSIDSLDGLAFEEALAKMTPAQRERYLQAA